MVLRNSCSAGDWYGWHWTDKRRPFRAMTRMRLECGTRSEDDKAEVSITGTGDSVDGFPWTLTGSMSSASQPQGSLEINFERYFDGARTKYTGTFLCDREVISGTFNCKIRVVNGSFLFKKISEAALLCAQPLVTTKLNTKELWSFACNAVLGQVRRKSLRVS